MQIISNYNFSDINVYFILNDNNRVVLSILPDSKKYDLLSEKNMEVYNRSSLVHLKLECHNSGMLSNSFKFSETLSLLKYKAQNIYENDESITVVTDEESEEGFGIHHYLKWYKGQQGFEVSTEFYNNSGSTVELEYLTSVSLDALSPCLSDEGSKKLCFHRFKAGWSMEGLHQCNTLTAQRVQDLCVNITHTGR